MCRKRMFWVKGINDLFCMVGMALYCMVENLYTVEKRWHIKAARRLEEPCGYERYTPKCIICICMYLYRVGYEPFLRRRG
jgi:hypothetical protein